MKRSGQMTQEEANTIFNVLKKECGADESDRDQFIHYYTNEIGTPGQMSGHSEYRICRKLGFGGKFRTNGLHCYVNYYQEDKTPQREQIRIKTNKALSELYLTFKIES